MRVVKQNAPGDPLNHGTVVFHAGANTAQAWADFKDFAEADQKWFELLTEQSPVGQQSQRSVDPTKEMEDWEDPELLELTHVGTVELEELALLSNERLQEAVNLLIQAGVTPEQYEKAVRQHEPIRVKKQAKRQSSRMLLDDTIKTLAGRLLAQRQVNPEGRDLDTKRLGRSNWMIVKAAIDKKVNAIVARPAGERGELTQAEIDLALERLDGLAQEVGSELFQ